MYLESFHPGITPEKVRENCSFDLNISRVKGETPHPTYRQLYALREFVDPERLFLQDPQPYPQEIQEIIDSF
jgi:glutaconate CoA-transferase subunit B